MEKFGCTLASGKEAISDIDTWLKNRPPNDYRKAENKLIEKHREALGLLLHNLGGMSNQNEGFLYQKEEDPPIKFILDNNSVTLLVTGILSKNVYNTLRSPPKSRAAKVISTTILPALTHVYEAFSSTEVTYFGMMVVYASRDFSSESKVSSSETVTLIVAKDKCKKFLEGAITDDELVNASDIYLSAEDNFRKIQVSLE